MNITFLLPNWMNWTLRVMNWCFASWFLALRTPWIELPKIFMHRSANHVRRTIHELCSIHAAGNCSFSVQAFRLVLCTPLVLRRATEEQSSLAPWQASLPTRFAWLSCGFLSIRLARIQHILYKNPIPSCGIVHQYMSHCPHQFAILNDGTTAHEWCQYGTTNFYLFWQLLIL